MAAGVVKSMGSVPWGITILNFELAFVRETGQAIISILVQKERLVEAGGARDTASQHHSNAS